METKPPKNVKVAGYCLEILDLSRKQANSTGFFGLFSFNDLAISVDMSQEHQRIVEILMHEITHAICKFYGIKQGDEEERFVSAMSHGWMQVWRDNPLLCEYVFESMKTLRGYK